MLIFKSIINLLLTPANTSFYTCKMFLLLQSKTQFLIKWHCSQCYSVFLSQNFEYQKV